MKGTFYQYHIEHIEDAECQAATHSSFRKSSVNVPSVACKNKARARVSGVTLCPVHLGVFLTYGAVAAAPRGMWQDNRRG